MLERGPKLQGRSGSQAIAKSKQERDQDGHHAKSLSTVGRNLNVVNKNRIFVRDRSKQQYGCPVASDHILSKSDVLRAASYQDGG